MERDEILIEGVYRLAPYRRQGVQHWRRARFFEKGIELGARWTLSYIRDSNLASLQSDVGVGYFPYRMRKDQWCFFRREFEFIDVRG